MSATLYPLVLKIVRTQLVRIQKLLYKYYFTKTHTHRHARHAAHAHSHRTSMHDGRVPNLLLYLTSLRSCILYGLYDTSITPPAPSLPLRLSV